MERSADDVLLSLPQLSRQSGVPAETLRSWTRLEAGPLAHAPAQEFLFTWAQLRAFAAAHPERRGARALLERLGSPPEAGSGAALRPDPRSEAAVLADLRAAVAASVETILVAARAAEASAAAHREQIESLAREAESAAAAHRQQLEQMAAAIRALDDVLIHATDPALPGP